MNLKKIAAICLGLVLAAAIPVWAANTAISSQTPKGPYPGTITATQLDLAWTAADTSNGNAFTMTGHEILLIWNTDSSSHTVTLNSVADVRGRSSDITAYSVGAGVISAFSYVGLTDGWMQSNGQAYFIANSALIKFAVITETR